MKKLFILTLFLSVLFLSCSDSGSGGYTPPPAQQCNCGTITDDEIVFDNWGNTRYTLSVRNQCTGNIGTWYFDYSIWLNNHVGDWFCISNVPSWIEDDFVVVDRINVDKKSFSPVVK